MTLMRGHGLDLDLPALELLAGDTRHCTGRGTCCRCGIGLRHGNLRGRGLALTTALLRPVGPPHTVCRWHRCGRCYTGGVTEQNSELIITPMPKRLVERIDDYRFEARVASRAEAIRRLIEARLKVEAGKAKKLAAAPR